MAHRFSLPLFFDRRHVSILRGGRRKSKGKEGLAFASLASTSLTYFPLASARKSKALLFALASLPHCRFFQQRFFSSWRRTTANDGCQRKGTARARGRKALVLAGRRGVSPHWSIFPAPVFFIYFSSCLFFPQECLGTVGLVGANTTNGSCPHDEFRTGHPRNLRNDGVHDFFLLSAFQSTRP